jgi:hypothetical protein
VLIFVEKSNVISNEMDNLLSGTHRFTGDPAHMKLRLVFTDLNMICGQQNTSIFHKYQSKTSMSQACISSQHQASYLLKKQQSTGAWLIEEEQCIGRLEAASAESTNSTNSSKRKAEPNAGDKLTAVLRQKGFVFKAMNVPSKSRAECHVCKGKLFGDSPSRAESNHKSVPHSSGNGGQISELDVTKHSTNKHHVARQTDEEDYAKNLPKLSNFDVSNEFSNLFLESRRACDWKDTLDLTSAFTSNGNWKNIEARKLTTDYATEEHANRSATTRARDTLSLFIRNHYLPFYEPCQCSRTQSTRTDKAFNDFCANLLICTPRSNDNGSASDNNENRNNLDRRRDNLAISIEENLRSRSSTSNFGSQPKAHHCQCGEFSEGYRRCQKLLLNGFAESGTSTIIDPLVSSPAGLIGSTSDNIVKRAINRKLAKLTTPNESSDFPECNSNDNILDLLLANLDLTQETSEHDNHDGEDDGDGGSDGDNNADFLCTIWSALLNSPPTNLNWESSVSVASNETDLKSDIRLKRKTKPLVEKNEASPNSGKICECRMSHSETVILVMEKYSSDPSRTGSNRNRDEQLDRKKNRAPFEQKADTEQSRSADDEKDGREEECISDKSDKKITGPESISIDRDEHAERSRHKQREVTLELDFDQPPTNAEKSLGTNDSGAVVSASNTSTDSDRANSTKISSVSQHGNPNQRHSTLDGNELDGYQAYDNDVKAQQCPDDLLLNAQELCTRRVNCDESAAQSDVQLEYSITLAVIIIDAFNGTIHMKPDHNELILLDMSTLSARSGRILNTAPVTLPAVDANPTDAKLSSGIDHMLFHIEIPNDDDEMLASEQDLNSLRKQFGLMAQVYRTQSEAIPMLMPSAGWTKTDSDMIPASTRNSPRGDISLLIQFDIDCASGFAKDCKNLYVKYKVYSINNQRNWRGQARAETSMRRGRDESRLRAASNIHDCHLKTLTHGRQTSDSHKDKTKLEHMIHASPKVWAPYDSSIDDNSYIAAVGKTGIGASEKWFMLGGGSHETNQVPMPEWCSNNFNDDSDHDKCSLLLEGSTVTSRPDTRGRFNFCCVEQLLLDLSRKTKESTSEGGKKSFSSNRLSQTGVQIADVETTTISEKSTDAMLRSSKPSVTVHSPTENNVISESSKFDDVESATATVDDTTGNHFMNDEIANNESSDNLPTDKIVTTTDRTRPVNPESCIRCGKSSGCECNQTDSKQLPWGYRSDDVESQNDLSDTNSGTFQILFIFEIYSSDFYSDRLKGWSSLNVPINLNEDNYSMTSNFHQPAMTSGSRDKTTQQARVIRKRADHRHRELHVMSLVFSSLIDRLRYFLVGTTPKNTPGFMSVSVSSIYSSQI